MRSFFVSPKIDSDKGQLLSAIDKTKPQEDVVRIDTIHTEGQLTLLVAIVADGENDQGERHAAEIAVQIIFDQANHSTTKNPQEVLRVALEKANTEILQRKNSGTVAPDAYVNVTAIAIAGKQLFIAHMGRTRAYLVREDKEPDCLTADHLKNNTGPWGLGLQPNPSIQTKFIDAENHPSKQIQGGDQIMLCTRGFYEGQKIQGRTQEEIVAALTEQNVSSAVKRLLSYPMGRNVNENVSVLVLRVPGGKRDVQPRWRLIIGASGAGSVILIALAFLVVSIVNKPTPTPTQADYPDNGRITVLQATNLQAFQPGSTVGQTISVAKIPSGYSLQNGSGTAQMSLFGAKTYLGDQTEITLVQIESMAPGEEKHIIFSVSKGHILVKSQPDSHTFSLQLLNGSTATLDATSGGALAVAIEAGNIRIDCLSGTCSLSSQGSVHNLQANQELQINDADLSDIAALPSFTLQDWDNICSGCLALAGDSRPTVTIVPMATPFTQSVTPIPSLPPDVIALAIVSTPNNISIALRSTPGIRSDNVIAGVANGDRVQILHDPPIQQNSYTWVKIRTATGKEGWVAQNYLKSISP